MPFITIELLEGRSQEQLKSMVQEVTEVISVFIEELKKDRYAVGGTLKSDEN